MVEPGGNAVDLLMRPRSVAIIGMSAKPGSAGQAVLGNLTVNQFAGDIHLVGRSGGAIDGRALIPDIDSLPDGVDLAIFTVPASAVLDAAAGCIRRKIGGAVIFAAGFAEMGDDQEGTQAELAALAHTGGLALLGPNCLGYTNYVDGFSAGFTPPVAVTRIAAKPDSAIAIVSHSGGLMGHLRSAFELRNLPVSYTVSTGNEAGLGMADFVDFLVDDPTTGAIVLYAEHIRQPDAFLAAASRARAAGKPVVMMHPGRGERALAATRSHTGALAGDTAVMRMQVAYAGIALVDTLEELIDVSEFLVRFPQAPTKGAGVLTFSGAFCAIVHDYGEALGLDIPPLSPESVAILRPRLPGFATPRNPLDLTTQPIWEPDLVEVGARALLDDPAMGSLLVSISTGGPEQSVKYLKGLIAAMEGSAKPVSFVPLGEGARAAPEFLALAREAGMIMSTSSERMMRAMAQITAHGKRLAATAGTVASEPFAGLPPLGSGPQPEYLGKQVLEAIGLTVPAGALARTIDDGVIIARRIGYPVALKAQAASLTHKTEAGGVILNVADDAALLRAWKVMTDKIATTNPGLVLDGILVEAMGARGLELVVGARRDPDWGPVLMVGLGGIWVEALGDVRLMPPDLPEPAIVEQLLQLKAAKLLSGLRGSPAVDVAAVAHSVALIGRLIQTVPEIVEIDVNPLVAYPAGTAPVALDALIVCR